MNLNIIINLGKLEPVSANAEQKLIGGFSSSIFTNASEDAGGEANNCLGGNCTSGCGVTVGPGQNVGCNKAAGCGA